MEEAWTKRWRFAIALRPVKPGVWRMKGGGHLIRGKARDYRTGKKKVVLRALRQTSASESYRALQEELDRIRSGGGTRKVERIRFDKYAASLFERKVAKGEIRSAQTRENWELNLRLHLTRSLGTSTSTPSRRLTSRSGWPSRRRACRRRNVRRTR